MTDNYKSSMSHLKSLSELIIFKNNDFTVEQIDHKIKKLFELCYYINSCQKIDINEISTLIKDIQN